MPEWLATWSTVVQAAAAVASFAAAGVIAWLTWRLAKSTDAYARSADKQVDELVRARLATIKPHMHVVSGSHGGRPGQYLDQMVVKVELKNLGSGPAIDLLARLEHDRLDFSVVTPLATVAVGDLHSVDFVAHHSSTDPGGQAISQELLLVAEYRDLAGDWWETRTPATLGYTREGSAVYSNPSVAFRVQEEVVQRLPQNRPTMQGALAAKDVTVPDRAFKTDLAGLS